MRVLWLVLFLALLGASSPAFAGTWNNCTTSDAMTDPAIVAGPGSRACYDQQAGDSSATPSIYVGRSFTLTYDPDTGQAGTPRGTPVTITIYRCSSGVASTSSCHDLVGSAFAGDNGSYPQGASIYNIPAGLYYVVPSGAPTSSATPRIRLEVSDVSAPAR